MVTGSSGTILFGMFCLQLPGQLPCLLVGRSRQLFQVPVPVLLTFICHTGLIVNQLPWMSRSFLLSKIKVSQAATSQGSALLYAEERKNIVHFEDCRRVGVSSFPLAVEVLGGWSLSAVYIISSLGQHFTSRRGSPPGQVIHHLFQKLCRSLEGEHPYVALSLSPSSPRGRWHYLTILFYFVLLLLLLLFSFSLFYFIFLFPVFCPFC